MFIGNGRYNFNRRKKYETFFKINDQSISQFNKMQKNIDRKTQIIMKDILKSHTLLKCLKSEVIYMESF